MKQTDAQLRATKKYQSKFEMLRVRVTPEEKQRIVEHAKSERIAGKNHYQLFFVERFLKQSQMKQRIRDNQK